MRKESSTNAYNAQRIHARCGMAYTLSLIAGRWKPAILWQLLAEGKRYTELVKSIPGASERMLIAQLRELEKDGLIKRSVFAEVPVRITYELTDLGFSMKFLLQNLSDWGDQHRG